MKKIILSVSIIYLFNTQSIKAQTIDSVALAKEIATSVLWTRSSGEYRALCFQAYNFAKLSLDIALKESKSSKPKCVIVDVDETVLDNSGYYEEILKEKKTLAWENWKNWLLTNTSDSIPGAVDFLRYAASKNVEVFYVTNREEIFTKSTMVNLKRFNFPNADPAHYFPSKNNYNKEPRRAAIAQTHEVLLLAGDNLKDFTNIFYAKGTDVKEVTNTQQQLFGPRFIVIPNSIYGVWKTKK